MSAGVQWSPASTVRIAVRISSASSALGMKPAAPKSMQRRITDGSSLAETMTTGMSGCWARRYIRPEKPCTPGMARSSSTRSAETSAPRAAHISSNEPASTMVAPATTPARAWRKAPRNSGWSSAMMMRAAESLTAHPMLCRAIFRRETTGRQVLPSSVPHLLRQSVQSPRLVARSYTEVCHGSWVVSHEDAADEG